MARVTRSSFKHKQPKQKEPGMSRPENWTVWVDLSTGKVQREPVDDKTNSDFLGGCGVGWKLAVDNLAPGIDPLSPQNMIIINPGILVGSPTPGTPKITAITKFPTIASDDGKHYIGSCTSGGRWLGIALIRAGCHHLVITGKAPSPVYLRVRDETVEIVGAEDLWGRGIEEVTNTLVRREGPETGVAVIGTSGENLVRHALAIVDKADSIGRGGLGAVMGSKNLKAIAVNGTGDVAMADPAAFFRLADELRQKVNKWPKREHWIKLGLAAGWDTFKHTQYPGIWPKDEWDKLYGEKTRLETVEDVIACNSCILACRLKWKIKGGEYDGEIGFGSPFSKSATSGMLLGVKDFRKMIHIVADANAFTGIDFYTTTRIIDFATKMYETGRLNKEDTGGLELKRSYDTYLKLYRMTVDREGFGDVLADGWYRLKKDFGLDPQEYWYAGICKGVDFIYDARPSNFHPLMMSFFTRPRPHHGGSHTRTNSRNKTMEEIREQVDGWGLPTETVDRIFTSAEYSGSFNVGRYTRYMEDMMRVKNSLGLCSIFSYQGLLSGSEMVKLYNAATGENLSAGELSFHGERISNLAKLINVREGFSRNDDRPPEVWFRPMDSPEGRIEMHDYFMKKQITKDDVEKLLDDYYDERGWDIGRGVPTSKKLMELGLEKYSAM
jgi:aldehyde:ferredoxin oxidoreductase